MKLAHVAQLAFAVALTFQGSVMAEQPGHITGIGGVFVKSKDPKALAQWYREVLGLEVKPWGAAVDAIRRPRSPSESVMDRLSRRERLREPFQAGVHDQLRRG